MALEAGERRLLREPRFPWVAAAAGALLVAAGGLSLFRLPHSPEPGTGRKINQPTLAVARVESDRLPEVLQEELALRDPAPLFLPTPWNLGQAELRSGPMEPGVAFKNFEEKTNIPVNNASLGFPPLMPVPGSPLDAAARLTQGPGLGELAHRELSLAPLSPRLALIEVALAGGEGQKVLSESVGELPATQRSLLTETFWSPIELLVAVSPGGIVGRPALVVASGSEQVDEWALDHLTGPARLGARLPPGFYRVIVGP